MIIGKIRLIDGWMTYILYTKKMKEKYFPLNTQISVRKIK